MAKRNPQIGKDFWMFKAPLELKKELDRIRLERIRVGKDKEFQSYNRLGLAISRHEKLLMDLMIADFKEGKKNG